MQVNVQVPISSTNSS